MTHYPQFFEETTIGKLKLKNKMSMAPMGPVGYADAYGAFSQRLQASKILKSDEKGVVVTNGSEEIYVNADNIINAIGYQSDDKLYRAIKELNLPVYNVGDSRNVHSIMYSIWDAYELARNI